MTQLTGNLIANRYNVLRLLGEGAMGAVYLAEDTELSRQVALKVLRPEIASMPDVHRRLDNECKIQAKIGPHPHMVTLFDKIVGENVILVMEYVPGENLADILDRTRILNAPENSIKTAPVSSGTPLVALDQASAIQIAIQCLDALDFAHSRGILHRDVKPSNILIMRDHNGKLVAKLMDFGIAKAISGMGIGEAMTSFTMVGGPGPGTPLYMSPEQIDSQRFGEPSASSDVYSMGVTLYEMLTLATPFAGTFTELINYHTNIEPPDPSTKCPMLSAGLKAVLAKALKKLPTERYQSAADFKLDLQASGGGTMIYGGQSYTASTSMGTPANAKKATASRLPQILGALAILLVVGAVTVKLVMERRGDDDEERIVAPASSPSDKQPANPLPTLDELDQQAVFLVEETTFQPEPPSSSPVIIASPATRPAPPVETPITPQVVVTPSNDQTAPSNTPSPLITPLAGAPVSVTGVLPGERNAQITPAATPLLAEPSGVSQPEPLTPAEIDIAKEEALNARRLAEKKAEKNSKILDKQLKNAGEKSLQEADRAIESGDHGAAIKHLEEAKSSFKQAADKITQWDL